MTLGDIGTMVFAISIACMGIASLGTKITVIRPGDTKPEKGEDGDERDQAE